MMDEISEPTHIAPIFWDLFNRQFLPLSGMKLHEHYLVPPKGFIATRGRYAWITKGVSWFVSGACKFGDNHIFVLKANQAKNGQ
jgi:hypothetical protein